MKADMKSFNDNIGVTYLNLYVRDSNDVTVTTPIKIYGVLDNSWSEDKITFNTAPSASNQILIGTINVKDVGWYKIDVTPFVQRQLTANKIVSFKLANETKTRALIFIDSKEKTKNTAYLEVQSAVNVGTSANRIGIQQQVEIYPNPTTGRLNISGVEAGNRIRIYSTTGALVSDMQARSNLEVVSLDDVPSGMFLIVISNDNQLLGRYKAIKSHSK